MRVFVFFPHFIFPVQWYFFCAPIQHTLCDCRAYISLCVELTLACMPCRMSPFQNIYTHTHTHCVHLEWQSAIKKWMWTRNRRLSTPNSVLPFLYCCGSSAIVVLCSAYLNRYKLSSGLCANEQDKLTQIQTITSYICTTTTSSIIIVDVKICEQVFAMRIKFASDFGT